MGAVLKPPHIFCSIRVFPRSSAADFSLNVIYDERALPANHWRSQMSDGTSFGLSTITQIAVNAHDIERAAAFYRDVLGMKFLFSAPPGLAFFDCAGVRLMLS